MLTLAALVCTGILMQEPKPVSLFDGKTLNGWHVDNPEKDKDPNAANPFIVRDGMLVSLGKPLAHIVTDASYENYRLTVEWRWAKEAGNSGVIVHVSKLRLINNFLPQGIEAQLRSGDAGDFHLFGEKLFKPGTEERAGKNSTDNSEKKPGEWNQMVVECKADGIKVWVNGDFVNQGDRSSATKGQIALQSEGAEIEFRKLEVAKL